MFTVCIIKLFLHVFCYQFCWNYQNVSPRFFRLKNSWMKTGLKTQERTPSLRTLKKYLSLKTQARTLNNLERIISRIPITSFTTLKNFCRAKKKKKEKALMMVCDRVKDWKNFSYKKCNIGKPCFYATVTQRMKLK